MNKLTRYIKNQDGAKVEMKTTSVNLEASQLEFAKSKKLNLSLVLRDRLAELMEEDSKEEESCVG